MRENLLVKNLRRKNAELVRQLKVKEFEAEQHYVFKQHLIEVLKNHKFEELTLFAETIEARDSYTEGHTERVTRYAIVIGHAMKLPEKILDRIYRAGLVHDIGKIYWDRNLFIDEELDPNQRKRIREHPIKGAEYLQVLQRYVDILPIVKHHHERYDGISIKEDSDNRHAGYPGDLSGEAIPLESRIIAEADTLDAMTTDRPYKSKMDFYMAFEELKRCSGLPYKKSLFPGKKSEKQFDPRITKALFSIKRVGSKKSKRYHKLICPDIHKIDHLNLIINPHNYEPCKKCA